MCCKLRLFQFLLLFYCYSIAIVRGGSLFGLQDHCRMVVCPGAGHGRCGKVCAPSYRNGVDSRCAFDHGNHGVGTRCVQKQMQHASNTSTIWNKHIKHIKQISNKYQTRVWKCWPCDQWNQWTLPGLFVSLLWWSRMALPSLRRRDMHCRLRGRTLHKFDSRPFAHQSPGDENTTISQRFHRDFTEISHRHRIRGTIVVSRMSNRNEKSIEKLQKSWRSRTSEHRKTIENHRISVCFSFFDVSKVSYIAWFSAASCGSCLTWMHATFDESYEFIWILMWKLCAMSDSSIEPLWTVVTLRWFRWLMVELSSSLQAPGRWRTAKQCNPPCIDSEPWAKCWNGAKPCRVSVPGFSEFSELHRQNENGVKLTVNGC